LAPEEERFAEVQRGRVRGIDEELLRQRLIQAELSRDQLEGRGGEHVTVTDQQIRGIDRDHAEQEEVEDQDECQGQQGIDELSEQVSAHLNPDRSPDLLSAHLAVESPPSIPRMN